MAIESSFTSLCAGSVSGGAGSVEDKGTGRGTERIVKRRSAGMRGSMGKIAERVVRTVVRTGEKRALRDVKRVLQ